MMPTTRGKYNTMKKLSETYRELGIAFTFPIDIKNADGNPTYSENSNGLWWHYEYDEKGKETYFEESDGYWCRCEYDEKGNQTYYETSTGYKGGTKRSSCSGKVVEIDGKKYKLTEL
jgi:uncharacterized protein RhaS with RHS repeats